MALLGAREGGHGDRPCRVMHCGSLEEALEKVSGWGGFGGGLVFWLSFLDR